MHRTIRSCLSSNIRSFRLLCTPKNKFLSIVAFVTLSVAVINSASASSGHGNSANGWSGNWLERLRAVASSPRQSLDPADYSLSLDQNCNYIVSSADRKIMRVIYFDLGGNRHVVNSDHSGNRLGTEVNLSETALAGVVEAGGTLFIKVRNKRGRWRGRPGVVEFSDIPVCGEMNACPAEIVNMAGVTVDLASDSLFIEHAEGNDDSNTNEGNPYSISTMPNSSNTFTECVSTNTITNEQIFIGQDATFPDQDSMLILRLDNSLSPPQIVAEPTIVLSREQSNACGMVLGCSF